jgi:hypothetical protein
MCLKPRTKETTVANMSYCRFQNTAQDLRDCVEAMEELEACPEDAERLSLFEVAATHRMAALCRRYLEAYEARLSAEQPL